MQLSTRIAASLLFASAVSGQAIAQGGSASFAIATASTEVVRSPETGLVKWLSGVGGQPVAKASSAAASLGYEQAARAFLESQSAAFGLRAGDAELVTDRIVSDNVGRTFVRFQQTYKGVPIIGAQLNVQMDGARDVRSVNGESAGDLDLSVVPGVSAANAVRIALRSTAGAHGVSMLSLKGSAPSLAVHDARIMGGPAAPANLVWRVEVTSPTRLEIRELVLVDAQNGRVSVQFNQTDGVAPADATQRICDSNNTSTNLPCKGANAIANPAGSAIQDVKSAFKFTENTFDFYARRFDRNSLNNNGLVLISTTRYCDPSQSCPFANAFWNGKQMVYGDSYASGDDVVGHELSHGFTEFTSSLLYFYQSGAINESLSDIFGELVDQSNGVDGTGGPVKWLLGEDLPIGAIRNMQNPPQFNDPDRMQSALYTGTSGDSGGVHTNSGVGNKTAFLMTQTGANSFNGQTVHGIGVDKSAAIWYRVNALLLNSGNDYADVGVALRQACKDLTGTRPKNQAGNPTGSGIITAANCTEVGKAILATELAKPPLVNPIPAEAPLCPVGQVATNQLFERFEAANPASFKFQPNNSGWQVLDFYAASNKQSVEGTSNSAIDTALEETTALKIPAAVPGTTRYLRFAHYYNMPSSAGGVVEYRVGAGAWIRVGATLFANNPYNATVSAGSGTVLANQRAFNGFSGGWTSSRIKLATLQGKTVKFRFRVVTGSAGGFDGWILDDVRIYGCRKAPAVMAME